MLILLYACSRLRLQWSMIDQSCSLYYGAHNTIARVNLHPTQIKNNYENKITRGCSLNTRSRLQWKFSLNIWRFPWSLVQFPSVLYCVHRSDQPNDCKLYTKSMPSQCISVWKSIRIEHTTRFRTINL